MIALKYTSFTYIQLLLPRFFYNIFLVATWFISSVNWTHLPIHTSPTSSAIPCPLETAIHWLQTLSNVFLLLWLKQGSHNYRNMAITIILHNHFQKDNVNVKQIISNSRFMYHFKNNKRVFKRNMTKLFKWKKKKNHYVLRAQETEGKESWEDTIIYLQDNQISQK